MGGQHQRLSTSPDGTVYMSSRASDGPPLPTPDGVLGSLDFIESRYPECWRQMGNQEDAMLIEETTYINQHPMPAHQLGFPAAMRHGVAPDVIGVLAVTPDVRVPLRSLGLTAPDEDGDEMNTEEQGVAPDMDLGAQVGVMLALEYTAGSRSHRLSNGTFGYVRPFSGAATAMPVR